jgi:Zinc dependent phospholipase C
MPPIFLHMALARDVAADLDSAPIESERGAYLLGATTPDIRVIARWERERTHFFNLDDLEHQDSVANFFAAYPALAEPESLTPATIAFISGYISHLVLDETWIVNVYRPFFGQLSALGGIETANTMDRILQFELDLRRRVDPEVASEINEALSNCSLAVDVGFLDGETLQRWLEVATELTSSPASWEGFRRQAARHLGVRSPEDWERFRDQIPELLQKTINHVSTAQVDAFLEQGRERSRSALQRYLGIPA